jgi:hypothetical protein
VDIVGDLAQDGREEQPPSTVADLPIVVRTLEEASGQVDMALLAGGRYRTEQLAALTGNSLAFLKRIVCTLAISYLFKRRAAPQYLELAKMYHDEAQDYLKALQMGKNLFNIEENKTASVIEHQHLSAVEIDGLNLMPSRMGNFFPSANSRTPR